MYQKHYRSFRSYIFCCSSNKCFCWFDNKIGCINCYLSYFCSFRSYFCIHKIPICSISFTTASFVALLVSVIASFTALPAPTTLSIAWFIKSECHNGYGLWVNYTIPESLSSRYIFPSSCFACSSARACGGMFPIFRIWRYTKIFAIPFAYATGLLLSEAGAYLLIYWMSDIFGEYTWLPPRWIFCIFATRALNHSCGLQTS